MKLKLNIINWLILILFLSLINHPFYTGRHYPYILAFRLTRSTDPNT